MAKYDAGNNMQGIIGVVGPTRMDYSSVAARLSYIADGISENAEKRIARTSNSVCSTSLQARQDIPIGSSANNDNK